MKSYIIFYVLWFVFSIVGWIGFIACNLDISVTSQMNIWFNYAIVPDIVISAILSMIVTFVLGLKTNGK